MIFNVQSHIPRELRFSNDPQLGNIQSGHALMIEAMGFWGSIGGCEPRLPDAACFTKPQEDIEMAKVRDHKKGFRTDRTLG